MMNKTHILIIGILVLALVGTAHTTHAQSQAQGCQNNQVCTVETDCNFETGRCTNRYTNCQPCGSTAVTCPQGGSATVRQTCVEEGQSARCVAAAPVCSERVFTKPTAITSFRVFIAKEIDITIDPLTQYTVAGESATYAVTLQNNNPKDLFVHVDVRGPPGWETDFPTDITLGPSQRQELTLTVHSPQTASEGVFPIKILIFNAELDISALVQVEYVIKTRGPPGITITPATQKGPPGSTKLYEVTVTNTDPLNFDASTITLDALPPEDWTATIAQPTLQIAPQASEQTFLEVTAPAHVNQTQSVSIPVNAAKGEETISAFARFEVNFCGNGICELNEVCAADCPVEQHIFCNGRCEQELDDGVRFKAVVDFPMNDFIVCSYASTPEECMTTFQQDTCGVTNACLCTSERVADCAVQCVDTQSAYYMIGSSAAQVERSVTNYTFICPFVDLADLMQARETFQEALDSYEQAKSSYDEQIAGAQTPEARAALQPCSDALERILRIGNDHITGFTEVIDHPSKSGARNIRAQDIEVRAKIAGQLRTHCEGAQGLLQFTNVLPPQTAEKGEKAAAAAEIKNVGDIAYFGYAQCDFIAPSNEILSVQTACTEFAPQQTHQVTPEVTITEEGNWRMQCRVIGSLESNCASTVHDESDVLAFGAGSDEVYIADVTGVCDQSGVLCQVETNVDRTCTRCFIDDHECTQVSHEGTQTTFSCPSPQTFTANLTATVFPTSSCVPVDPTRKTTEILCPGCGDGVVDETEQCELPSTDNNAACAQIELTCDGYRQGIRDGKGYCTNSCSCSNDQFTFACVAGACGAECSDGQEQDIIINGSVYTQHCQADCTFSDVIVEIPAGADECTYDDDCGIGFVCQAGACQFSHCPETDDLCYFNGESCQACSNGHACINGACEEEEDNTTCAVDIKDSSCSFDRDINRYTIAFDVSWQGGHHAHASAEREGDGIKQFFKNFTHETQIGNPGFKTLRAAVHDIEDRALCTEAKEIYCGVQNATSDLVQVQRNMAELASFGDVPIELHIATTRGLNNLQIEEQVEVFFPVENLKVTGNRSTVRISGPELMTSGTKQFNTYTFIANVLEGDEFAISYSIDAQREGDFTFKTNAKYLNQQQTKEDTLSVTSCPQIHPVVARNEAGDCQEFKTACDVKDRVGWVIVPSCDDRAGTDAQPPREPKPKDDGIGLTMSIILLVIILGVAYYKRAEIKQFIEERRGE